MWNHGVFTEANFIASIITDVSLNERTDLVIDMHLQNNEMERKPNQSLRTQATEQINEAQAGCSHGVARQNKAPEVKNYTSFLLISPKELIPMPTTKQNTSRAR